MENHEGETFDPADPPEWALQLAADICDEEFEATGQLLNARQVVWGFANAKPRPEND